MEKAGKDDHVENDYIQLTRVTENNQASHLLKLLIITSSICDLKGLLEVVINELKQIVDFADTDLLLFDETNAGLQRYLTIRSPQQFHRSQWLDQPAPGLALLKKEMAFEYTYYIPFVEEDRITGMLQFRTNRKGGFSPRNRAVLHISGKILTPKFLDLIRKTGLSLPDDKTAPGDYLFPGDYISPGDHPHSGDHPNSGDHPIHNDLIGRSDSMKKVYSLLSQVAPTQSGVLILGETGTGKELIARALHNASSRRNKPMIKVNCAALPASIIESELFGHEKGSFTGAIERRIGKFELAHNSTLFLDEVGDLPPEIQVKLLRALQEKEIERIGGRDVIKVNVRIVAATNRPLLKDVQNGRFRSDLYFRLNVFPLTLPPLRERKEDIPMLAHHFLSKYTRENEKKVTGFSSRVMKELKAYDWPGNIRELEHLIERCAVLVKGDTIKELPVSLAGLEEIGKTVPGLRIKTIDEVEREHILFVLKKCKGKVAGVGGAAETLKIPWSTLNSKIKRLKIKKTFWEQI